MVIALIAVHGRPAVARRADLRDRVRHGAVGRRLLLRAAAQAAEAARRGARRGAGQPPDAQGDLSVEPRAAARCGSSAGSPVASSLADLAERAEPLGDDVVLVDRLEVDLAGRDERAVVELGEARRRRRGSSRARSPRRTAGGGGPSRRRAPRRSASSARRSPTTSTARRSRAASAASISSSHSSVQPMCSVPRPRWLWVATGTASRICSISSSSKPSLSSRSRAVPATSSCAHGQAVIPWAVTPISRRVPSSVQTAEPCSVYSSCVLMPDTGAGLCSGKRASTRHLGAARALARRGPAARCARPASRP